MITQRIYSNADSVVAYGGDSLNPPVYGKVYIAIKTKTGSLLNDATKKEISADLRKYSMASIDPVVVDPDNVSSTQKCLRYTILVQDLHHLKLKPIFRMQYHNGQVKHK